MTEAGVSSENRIGVKAFVFFALLFSYPILSLLWRRDYPFFTSEVSLLFALVVVLSLFFSFLVSRARSTVSYLLTGILVLFVFSIQFDLLLEGMIICIAVTALLMFMFRDKFRVYGITIIAALVVGAWLDSQSEHAASEPRTRLASRDSSLPPVVHIVLDGFIGIAGLPPYPASEIIRDKILAFMEANHFHLFSHAYSRYAVTSESLDATLNYRHDGEGVAAYGGQDFSAYIMKENAVFSAMEALDYRLNVYQTNHLGLCQSNPDKLDRCWQYDHPDILSVRDNPSIMFRAGALLSVLLDQSRVLSKTVYRYGAFPQFMLAVYDPRLFDTLKEDIGKRGNGNYFFAHALIPHGPFAYQPDCSVDYNTPPGLRRAFLESEPPLSPIMYEIRYGLYFGQAECALRTLQSLIDSMKREGLYDRAIIVLHGDHGSRIVSHSPLFRNKALLTADEYRSSFSTLFAVKYPGSDFLVDERPLSISYLTEELFAALPAMVNGGGAPVGFNPSGVGDRSKTDTYVYLTGKFPMERVDIDLFGDRAE